jgi:hypothetical protein
VLEGKTISKTVQAKKAVVKRCRQIDPGDL